MSLFALAAIFGTGLGPVWAGWVEENASLGWRWIEWIQAAYTGAAFIIILFFLKETRGGVVLTRRAVRLRKETGDQRYRARAEAERASIPILIKNSLSRPILSESSSVLLLTVLDLTITLLRSARNRTNCDSIQCLDRLCLGVHVHAARVNWSSHCLAQFYTRTDWTRLSVNLHGWHHRCNSKSSSRHHVRKECWKKRSRSKTIQCLRCCCLLSHRMLHLRLDFLCARQHSGTYRRHYSPHDGRLYNLPGRF